MTTIFMIRHAEAEGNLYRRIHGHYDSLITARGKQQIEALHQRFENIHIDAVYSSDLFRTRTTAGAITNGRTLELQLRPQLREVAMGAWEDLTWGDVEREEPKQLEYFNNDPLNWNINGGEAYGHLQKRIADAVKEIADRHDGQAVAVVTHGSAIRAFLGLLLNVSPHEIRRIKHCDNTAVTLLRVNGDETIVDYYGDNSHLSEELSTFAHQKWWRENTTFDSTNVRYVPFDLINDAGRYLDFRSEAYEAIYGRSADNMKKDWLEHARRCAAKHSRAVSLAMVGDTPVGIVELDTGRGEAERIGDISFIYMNKNYRRTGMTVQFLGQAVSVYRSLGRERLRMAVEETNEDALSFCEKYGFVKTGQQRSDGINQLIIEMDIALR